MNTKALQRRIDVACGRVKADLVLKRGNVLNVFSEEIAQADVAVADGVIAGVGTYSGVQEVDCTDKFIVPGFIDAHVHVESSMVTPEQFARAVLPSGTTCVVADPHEIVNVCGAQAVRYLLDATEGLPVGIYLMLPSSVPSTPFETSGAEFLAADMAAFFSHPRVLGLGEVMAAPAVLSGEESMMEKLTLTQSGIADGHAPLLSGAELQAYACTGIATEHECTSFSEAAEKLRAGLAILVREGSAAHNLTSLLRGWLDSELPADRFLFCTDDKHLDDIARDGHIRHNIRLAISLGVPPITAIKMATRNAAVVYGLRDRGAVAPGYRADLVVLSSLKQVTVDRVYAAGVLSNEALAQMHPAPVPEALSHSMHGERVTAQQLRLPVGLVADCIEMVPYQIITKHVKEAVPQQNGLFVPNAAYSKLCVVERHGRGGGIAVCPLKGYHICGGAIATSVAHDSHNIIAAGDNDADLVLAIQRLKEIGGGYVLAKGGQVLGELPLPVGGLMSSAPWETVQRETTHMLTLAKEMGIPESLDPFISLSFLALPVIPEIRLTDKGLFDATTFSMIERASV